MGTEASLHQSRRLEARGVRLGGGRRCQLLSWISKVPGGECGAPGPLRQPSSSSLPGRGLRSGEKTLLLLRALARPRACWPRVVPAPSTGVCQGIPGDPGPFLSLLPFVLSKRTLRPPLPPSRHPLSLGAPRPGSCGSWEKQGRGWGAWDDYNLGRADSEASRQGGSSSCLVGSWV